MVVDGVLVVDLERAVTVLAHLESGGDYSVGPDADGRSGAYGYSGEQWRGYAGYGVAADAPASVQDARARADVQRLLVGTDGDLLGAVGRWFVERAEGTAWWEDFPAEHRLSTELFVERWLGV